MLNPDVPAIELPREGQMTIRTPDTPDVRRWFFDNLGWRIALGSDPDDLGGVTLPRSHLDRVTRLLLSRWPEVELFRQYQPGMVCTHRCRYAKRLSCACPCSGEQHGSQSAEVPLVPRGGFTLIGTGVDDWSLVRITHQMRN